MKRLFRSIRWRLLLWHSLISLGLVVAVALLANRLATDDRMERIERDLARHERSFFRSVFTQADGKDGGPLSLEEIRARLLAVGEPAVAPPEFRDLFRNEPGGTYIAVWDAGGAPLFISPNAPAGLEMPDDPPRDGTRFVSRGPFHEHQRGHPSGTVTVVGRDVSNELAALYRFRILLALGGASILLAALAGGWWLAGRVLKPIGSISHTASRIAAGNLEDRIALAGGDSELDQLARVLNETFDRLASAIELQKRFTTDASHELRTPLTIILSETQRALKSEREPAQYRQFLTHCQTAANRMRGIVDSLLILARQDLADLRQQSLPCDLAELAAQLAARMAPIAEERSSAIHLVLCPAPVSSHPGLLETLAENLLSNALSHPPPGTPVTLRTLVRDAEAVLEVHDQGPGIEPVHLPKLFDRFYRADPARSQSAGHSGLGLAISRSIATSLGGKLEVESDPSTGTIFRFSLPAAAAEPPPA